MFIVDYCDYVYNFQQLTDNGCMPQQTNVEKVAECTRYSPLPYLEMAIFG